MAPKKRLSPFSQVVVKFSGALSKKFAQSVKQALQEDVPARRLGKRKRTAAPTTPAPKRRRREVSLVPLASGDKGGPASRTRSKRPLTPDSTPCPPQRRHQPRAAAPAPSPPTPPGDKSSSDTSSSEEGSKKSENSDSEDDDENEEGDYEDDEGQFESSVDSDLSHYSDPPRPDQRALWSRRHLRAFTIDPDDNNGPDEIFDLDQESPHPSDWYLLNSSVRGTPSVEGSEDRQEGKSEDEDRNGDEDGDYDHDAGEDEPAEYDEDGNEDGEDDREDGDGDSLPEREVIEISSDSDSSSSEDDDDGEGNERLPTPVWLDLGPGVDNPAEPPENYALPERFMYQDPSGRRMRFQYTEESEEEEDEVHEEDELHEDDEIYAEDESYASPPEYSDASTESPGHQGQYFVDEDGVPLTEPFASDELRRRGLIPREGGARTGGAGGDDPDENSSSSDSDSSLTSPTPYRNGNGGNDRGDDSGDDNGDNNGDDDGHDTGDDDGDDSGDDDGDDDGDLNGDFNGDSNGDFNGDAEPDSLEAYRSSPQPYPPRAANSGLTASLGQNVRKTAHARYRRALDMGSDVEQERDQDGDDIAQPENDSDDGSFDPDQEGEPSEDDIDEPGEDAEDERPSRRSSDLPGYYNAAAPGAPGGSDSSSSSTSSPPLSYFDSPPPDTDDPEALFAHRRRGMDRCLAANAAVNRTRRQRRRIHRLGWRRRISPTSSDSGSTRLEAATALHEYMDRRDLRIRRAVLYNRREPSTESTDVGSDWERRESARQRHQDACECGCEDMNWEADDFNRDNPYNRTPSPESDDEEDPTGGFWLPGKATPPYRLQGSPLPTHRMHEDRDAFNRRRIERLIPGEHRRNTAQHMMDTLRAIRGSLETLRDTAQDPDAFEADLAIRVPFLRSHATRYFDLLADLEDRNTLNRNRMRCRRLEYALQAWRMPLSAVGDMLFTRILYADGDMRHVEENNPVRAWQRMLRMGGVPAAELGLTAAQDDLEYQVLTNEELGDDGIPYGERFELLFRRLIYQIDLGLTILAMRPRELRRWAQWGAVERALRRRGHVGPRYYWLDDFSTGWRIDIRDGRVVRIGPSGTRYQTRDAWENAEQ